MKPEELLVHIERLTTVAERLHNAHIVSQYGQAVTMNIDEALKPLVQAYVCQAEMYRDKVRDARKNSGDPDAIPF